MLKRKRGGRSPLVLFVLLLVWCLVLGIGLAQAREPQARLNQLALAEESSTSLPATIGTVDPVPSQYQLGQEIYLQTCATCHIAIPPAVLPTDTWRLILRDPRHFGAELQPFQEPNQALVWGYLRTFSRPLRPDEHAEFRVGQSRYFKALHPRVDLPRQISLDTCITCHPGASQYDFRSLTPQWQDAP